MGVFLVKNIGDVDFFKQVEKDFAKENNISPQKPKFEIIENVMVISIKNHLKME